MEEAWRAFAFEATITKRDKYHRLIRGNLAYVSKDQAETSVLFELISARYERRLLVIEVSPVWWTPTMCLSLPRIGGHLW